MLLVWQLNYDRLNLMSFHTKPTFLNAHLNIIIHTEYFSNRRLKLPNAHRKCFILFNSTECFEPEQSLVIN